MIASIAANSDEKPGIRGSNHGLISVRFGTSRRNCRYRFEDHGPSAAAATGSFGAGFYMAIDMGANVYQDRGPDQNFTNDAGDTLLLSSHNQNGLFRAGSKQATSLAPGFFVPPLKDTSQITGGNEAGVALSPVLMA